MPDNFNSHGHHARDLQSSVRGIMANFKRNSLHLGRMIVSRRFVVLGLLAGALITACSQETAAGDAGAGTDFDVKDPDIKVVDADTKDLQFGDKDTEIRDSTDDVDAELVDGVDAETGIGPDGSDDGETAVDPDGEVTIGPDGEVTIGPDADVDGSETKGCQSEFPANPGTGAPGASCVTNDDCDFNFCVETANGKVCTHGCDNTQCACPSGWGCEVLNPLSPDPTYGCVPASLHVCDPCTTDAQCQSSGDQNALCLNYGDAGHFCGTSCGDSKTGKASDDLCPNGYYCLANAKGVGGGTSAQCMTKAAACTCSILAIKQGYSTECADKNVYGTCKGTRQCSPTGLTNCTAKSPSAEVCNGLDDNCDGAVDEPGAAQCTVFWQDTDKDGFGNSPQTGGDNQCLCKASELYSSASPTDCDDTNGQVKPGAAEICDGIDNDCNGKTDETCDEDKDGYCDATAVIVGKTKACKYVGADCDDGNPKIHPGQPEVCGNSIDDDCDGTTDQGVDGVGCDLFYEDGDKDGVGTFANVCACAANGIYTASKSGDCNDSNKNVYPGNKEVCGNGIDDNCNGKQDEEGALNCTSFYKDADSDGYGAGKAACLCTATATYTTAKGGDCNDNDPKMNPAMTEVCNSIDDDCDGTTDNNNALGCSTFYKDQDKDGFGDSKKFLCLCSPVDYWTATIGNDCEDGDKDMNPVATEICDSKDNDCNGVIDDPNAQGCVKAYKDADGDGYGNPVTQACVCGLLLPYNTFQGGDCDDKDKTIHPYPGETNPQKKEHCNGKDDDCNGITDDPEADGCTVYYADSDLDGAGNSAKSKCLCVKDSTYSTTKNGDCNDIDPTIKPGTKETCDGKDNDCDGTIDNEGAISCNTYYADADNDGYGDILNVTKCLCSPVGVWKVIQGGDCNDANNEIHPSVTEKCDTKDNDCDGTVDPPNSQGCVLYYPDKDNDGWGDQNTAGVCQCSPAYPNTSTLQFQKDCNDANPLISPGSFEVCGDLIDNNCNGVTDESVSNQLFYMDKDSDGFGTGTGMALCKPDTINGIYYSTTVNGDCNDALPKVHPNAQELCNAIDDDCNGLTDEQLPLIMCGDAQNGQPACVNGKCTPNCYPSWFDADGIASNGCECKADNFYGIQGDACTSPVDLGYIYDDGSVTLIKAGNIMPGESGDWFHFKAVDYNDPSGSCDPFNVHVWLNPNPDGKYVIDFYRNGCGAPQQLCGNEVDSGWTVAFSGKSPYGPGAIKGNHTGDYDPSPIPEVGGECKCVNGTTGLPGMNECTDNSADFYVRVGRAPGSGTVCASYTLNITNGM